MEKSLWAATADRYRNGLSCPCDLPQSDYTPNLTSLTIFSGRNFPLSLMLLHILDKLGLGPFEFIGGDLDFPYGGVEKSYNSF